jgi:2-polyprenyl-3-methyl-5-hydroxy-6-metoxy-1,4-benzoquinol methylase
MNTVGEIRDRVDIFEGQNQRWDREWLEYFIESNPKVYFISSKDLTVVCDVRGKSPLEVHNTTLVTSARLGSMGALRVWMDGDSLIGKNLLEIGCGAGFSGKQLGLLAASYIGIDYSRFALSIARLTSPENCLYYHMSDLDNIAEHAGTVDVMVSRDFFIHQNYANIVPILRLGALMLKAEGVISADFWLTRPYGYQPVTHPATSDLDPLYPSCSFLFSMEDIERAAEESGLAIQDVTDIPDLRRRFVRFRKRGSEQIAGPPEHIELHLPEAADQEPSPPAWKQTAAEVCHGIRTLAGQVFEEVRTALRRR